MPNLVKNIIAIALIIAGLAIYQYLESQITSLRVLAFLVSLTLAGLVFSTTQLGQKSKEFLANARLELKKIKWADKKQTGQMTLMIFLAVFVVGLFLWLVDSIVFRLLQWVIN